MSVVHQWLSPELVYVSPKKVKDQEPAFDRYATARQVCGRCGTVRNPITGTITQYYGGRMCEGGDPEEQDHSRALKRVHDALIAMESDGLSVSIDDVRRTFSGVR